MKTFWMTWSSSSRGWPVTELLALVARFDRDGTADQPWRIHAHKQAKPGDRVFLFKQGAGPRGIFGAGEVTGIPSIRPDLSPDPTKPQHFVPVHFSRLVDPMQRMLLRVEDLEDVVPKELISAERSGIGVDARVAAVIARRLGLPDAPENESTDEPRNPPWCRDELILALDVYVRWNGNPPSRGSTEISDLSQTLNDLQKALGVRGEPTLRNANGVYMKLMNLRRFDPDFAAQGKVGLTRGNRLEAEIWSEFHDDPPGLRLVADAIRRSITEASSPGALGGEPDNLLPDEEEAVEGRLLTVQDHRRERSRRIVLAKKTAVMKSAGKLACEGCGFDFRDCYGPRGETFIECHHIRPVAELGDGTPTRMNDLVLVCANCHRMIHAKRPWWTLENLRAALRASAFASRSMPVDTAMGHVLVARA